MNKFFIFLLLLLSFSNSFSKEVVKTDLKNKVVEKDEFVEEFEGSKFLQIDKIALPNELEKIKDQINQNMLDIILSTRTHTSVFAQKYEEGYTKKYKNFYGLEVSLKNSSKEDYYDLEIFYYNWTTNKFDKKLQRMISVYNVLNEIRFAMYETLLGSDFVKEHKDEIEAQNYNRIQTIRKNEELNKIKERQLKKGKAETSLESQKELTLENIEKIKRQEEIKKYNNFIEEFKEDINLQKKMAQSPTGLGAFDKKSDNSSDNQKNADEKDQQNRNRQKKKESDKVNKKNAENSDQASGHSQLADGQRIEDDFRLRDLNPELSLKSKLAILGNYHNEGSESVGIVSTTTYLRYINLGVRYRLASSQPDSWFGEATIKTGMPIKKKEYKFPVYKNADILLGHHLGAYFSVVAGINYSPLSFVNLNKPGEGLKVFQNDIYWGQVGGVLKLNFYDRDIALKAIYSKSLLVDSNFKKNYSGTSISIHLLAEITKKMALEITMENRKLTGDTEVTNSNVGINYIYSFKI